MRASHPSPSILRPAKPRSKPCARLVTDLCRCLAPNLSRRLLADGEDAGAGVAREGGNADLVHDEGVVALVELLPHLRGVAFDLAEAVPRRRPAKEEIAGAVAHRR